MTRHQLTLVLALLLGVAIGAFGGYRDAEDAIGRDALAMLHKDAATTLRSYERIKELALNQEHDKLMNYLDDLVHTQSAVLKATASNPAAHGPSANE